MEPKFWDKNPFKATAKAFPPGFHYKPTTILKTRTFYELILVDSNSVSIKHFKDPKDQTLNTHSTIQILKVLQPRHFGSDLNKGKRFSVPFDPVGYTYWDYVDAWTKVFWHQNTRFKHSWLIYFKTNTIYNFPNWFLQWWDFFGPIPEIFPETVQQGFSQFKKQYNSQESRIPADLKYFSSFALSWIFSWQYRYNKTEKTNQYPSLQRHAFVKWWTQFDSSKADPEQVKLWFQSHPEFLKAADPETSVFLNQKSHLAAFLAGSTSKEVLAKNLKEVLQMLQQEEEASSSKKEETSSAEEDEEDPFYQNEDDCFGKKLHWLEVSGSGLRGTIPTEIGKLPKLTHLNLSRNYLDGAIPSSLGNLILLQSLVISSNIVQEMCKCPTCGVSRYKVKDDESCDDATTKNNRPAKMACFADHLQPPSLVVHQAKVMMIAVPRQPGNDIDVYLTPLIEDLRKLWEVWDENLQ
ncbi:hypothetical protein D0Y65_009513 [Glycine soja]|uniref:Uncharacterized protein n=1 Tax=Glycine soja TaxID=3848 RepID=A0A445KZD0_GLYSO|nr:hypothetical protein D0Y65_009513 [Glycine soja]